jgi:predicted MPP superfamily phosphohydrolase
LTPSVPDVVAAAALAVAARALWEPHLLEVTHHRVHLPGSARPVRVLHLTDLHGRRVAAARLGREARRPDLVVFTGDLVSGERQLARAESALRDLVAALPPVPRLAVLGNHDVLVGPQRVEAALARAGFRLLRNEAVALPSGLWVAGIDDSTEGVPDLDGALSAVPPGAPVLLLSHGPQIFPSAALRDVPLVLCGHTHGGQVRLPVLGALFTAYRLGRGYDAGWFARGASRMYVGRGLGTVHLPVRFLCPPEVAVFDLYFSS